MNFPINRIYYIAIITFAIVLSYYLLAGKNKFPKLWRGKIGLVIFAILSIIIAIWRGPVKKKS